MCRAPANQPIIANDTEEISSASIQDAVFSLERNIKTKSPRTIFNDYWLYNKRSSSEATYIDCRNLKNLKQYRVIPLQSNCKKVRFNPLIVIFEFEAQ